MNLSTVQQLIYRAMKTNDATYPTEHVTDAVRLVGEKFLRETGLSRTSGSVTLANAASTLDVVTTLTDFRPERLLQIHQATSFEPVSVVDYDTVRRSHENNSSTGEPELLGWQSDALALVYPTADQAYTLTVIYSKPLISTTGANPTLNIPDEYCYEAFYFAGPAVVEHTDPNALYADRGWQRFEKLIEDIKRRSSFDGAWSMPTGV